MKYQNYDSKIKPLEKVLTITYKNIFDSINKYLTIILIIIGIINP